MSKAIVFALSILAALVVIWLLLSPEEYTSTTSGEYSEGFRSFLEVDPTEAVRITLKKGEGEVELKKESDDGWVVASSYGYPANEEQIEKMLESLDDIESGEEVGRSAESHEALEVGPGKGGFIRLFDKSGSELASVVVGKFAPSGSGIGSTRIFIRFGDDDATYSVESGIRSDTRFYNEDIEGKNYLETEVVQLPEDVEVETLRLVRPEKPDLIVERRYREVPVEEDSTSSSETPDAAAKEDGEEEEKEPETKKEPYFVVTEGSDAREVGKSEEWTARTLIDKGKNVRVEDAVEPKAFSEYGLDDPQLEAIVHYRKKDDPDAPLQRLTLLFGNERKDEKGETDGYYFAIEGEEYGGRVYVIQDYAFDGWNKEFKDFLPKPKEEEKEAEEESEAGETPEASETPEAGATPGASEPPEAEPPTEEGASAAEGESTGEEMAPAEEAPAEEEESAEGAAEARGGEGTATEKEGG